MPRKKKEKLVHIDLDSLSKQTEQKKVSQPTSLGDTLRAKREKKKLTQEDVARKLCIKEVYIKALEEGHYYAFPSRVYGVGFLRTYAKFLGLDSDLMVAEFHAETSDIKDAPLDMPVVEKRFALPSKKTLTFFAFLILVLVVLWGVVSTLVSSDVLLKLPQISAKASVKEPETTTVSVVEEAPVVADESLLPVEEKEEVAQVPQAEVAFVAQHDVWVRLYNSETQKVILDKVLRKDDVFVPEASLAVLELTTGRERGVCLYKKGEKVKTFGLEKSRSLAEFAEN